MVKYPKPVKTPPEEPVVPSSFWALLAGICMGFLMATCVSCTTTKYVEVPGPTHTEYVHRTDSFWQTDTLIDKETTIIREADSATLARYGIQLQSAQKAWLIQSEKLQREIEKLKQTKADTVHVTDSIPYPVEVPVEVPAQLTWWQHLRIHLGGFTCWLLILAAGVGVFRIIRKIRVL